MMRRVRHKKRGTEYDVIGTAELQMARDLVDGAELIIYRGVGGLLWARSAEEFEDGRFEDVPPPPVDPNWKPDFACDECMAWDDCYDRGGCERGLKPRFSEDA